MHERWIRLWITNDPSGNFAGKFRGFSRKDPRGIKMRREFFTRAPFVISTHLVRRLYFSHNSHGWKCCFWKKDLSLSQSFLFYAFVYDASSELCYQSLMYLDINILLVFYFRIKVIHASRSLNMDEGCSSNPFWLFLRSWKISQRKLSTLSIQKLIFCQTNWAILL